MECGAKVKVTLQIARITLRLLRRALAASQRPIFSQ